MSNCTRDYNPVCCLDNRNDYNNACQARTNGCISYVAGICADQRIPRTPVGAPPPVPVGIPSGFNVAAGQCTTDSYPVCWQGKTYLNPCAAIMAGGADYRNLPVYGDCEGTAMNTNIDPAKRRGDPVVLTSAEMALVDTLLATRAADAAREQVFQQSAAAANAARDAAYAARLAAEAAAEASQNPTQSGGGGGGSGGGGGGGGKTYRTASGAPNSYAMISLAAVGALLLLLLL